MDRLIVREVTPASSGSFEVHVGDAETIELLQRDRDRPLFDEWRGGVGLSLLVARRIIDAHGGTMRGAPAGRKTGAVVIIPAA